MSNAAGRVTGGVIFMFAGLLFAADSRVDHVTVAGSDLARLQTALKSIGIDSVYGGAHSNHATAMALVSFPDGSYLELMGLQANADPKAVSEHVWATFLKENAGPCAWALRAPDLAAEIQRLKAAGITVSAPVRSGRQRPDGVRLEWETSDVGTALRGTFFPFLIQDLTPRNQRAYPQGKPVTREFRGVARVVIAVKSLDDAIQRYHAAYDSPPPIKQADKEWGAYMALLGNMPVILAQPLNADSWLNERLAKFGEAPCAFILQAANPPHFKNAPRTRWFSVDIGWFDEQKLGWRLGFQ
ncbi:MAG TPA: VOC family protein [Candidatus Acidoferrales bacterium]|nr:VOC family protein [Candidatus Acidoferrales bacterium]